MTKTRVEGLSDVNSVLRQLPRGLGRPVLIRVGKRRLEPMRDAASRNAPKATGELSEKIIISTRQETGGRRKRYADKAEVEIVMGPTQDVAEKAVPQEFGFRGVPPKGFMRRAWDEHSGALLDGIAEDLGNEAMATAARYAKRVAKRGG